MTEDIKFTKTARDWRRNVVLEKLSKGWSQAQIAKELKIHPSTISLDVQYLKTKAQEQLKTHIQEVIPFEFQKSRQAISDLIKKANEILDNNSDDPKLQLQVINVLTNLWMANSNINSEGNIIEQAYKKVQTLLEIHERRSDEAVFSEEDIVPESSTKEDTEPANTKITTIDDQDSAPEPEEETEEE